MKLRNESVCQVLPLDYITHMTPKTADVYVNPTYDIDRKVLVFHGSNFVIFDSFLKRAVSSHFRETHFVALTYDSQVIAASGAEMVFEVRAERILRSYRVRE